YDFHRKWWGLRARLSGDKLQFFKDEELILEAVDPEPLQTGRVAIWTMHNGIIVSRAKIYYEDEKTPADAIPGLEGRQTPVTDSVESRVITVSSESHPAIYDDFEIDAGRWQSYGGPNGGVGGAKLTLVAPGADGSGYALAMINERAGGHFGSKLKAGRLDARKYGQLSFDYNVQPDAKLNLYCVVNSGTYEVVFTAPGEVGPKAQILAEFPSVEADGKWHHADLDLVGYLERVYGPEEELWIEDVYFANTHYEGYIHAGFGGNRAGTTLAVDNFYLGGSGPSELALTWAGEGVASCAWTVDDQPYTEPTENETTETELTRSLADSGTYYAHVRPKLADGTFGAAVHRKLLVDVDAPRIVSQSPKNGESSGAALITARLTDPGGSGIDVRSLKLNVQGQEFAYNGTVMQYNPEEGLLSFDPARAGITLANGDQVAVELAAVTDRLGHSLAEPVKWTYKHTFGKDSTPPTTPYVVSSDDYLCRDDFETDLGDWSTFGGPDGAVVCRDPSTVAGGLYSLRLFNNRQGGRFGAYVRKERFDVGKYRLMSFDYKCTGRLRADFGLYVNGRWRSVRFTDSDSTRSLIGEIPDVQTDGEWHHAEVDLFEMLRKADPTISSYDVRYLILADWGYMGNAAGRTYYIDNFKVIPVTNARDGVQLSWASYDASGIAGASYVLDQSEGTDPGKTKMIDGTSLKLDPEVEGDCWFHVRAIDNAGNWSEPGHLRLILDKGVPTVELAGPLPDSRAAASKIVFDVQDEGMAGIDPASLKLTVDDQAYDMSSAYLSYDAEDGKLIWDGTASSKRPVSFEDGQTVKVALLGAADFVGNEAALPPAYQWTMDYSQDNESPEIYEIKSTSHLTLADNTFESGDMGLWRATEDLNAVLSVDESDGATGAKCLTMKLGADGGTMGAVAYDEEYSADRYPYISFDYKLDPGVKVDLVVQMDGEYHGIRFTDDAGNVVGGVSGALADGQWHHATLQLATMLRKEKKNGPLDVQQVILIDRGNADTQVGAIAKIDNFMIARVGKSSPSFRWKAADATGITDYSYVLDQTPVTVPDDAGEGLATTKTFRGTQAGQYYFHIRAKDGAGHCGDSIHYGILHISAPKSG
ncbi:MAG TPA: hypothetical protein QGH10_18565, partial [Armatimonadota bacterium]|nr:hypothetical protein [Armatimonadota bacterium]